VRDQARTPSIAHSLGKRRGNGAKKSLVKDKPVKFAWNDGDVVALAMIIWQLYTNYHRQKRERV
jgi:hypothetical protein